MENSWFRCPRCSPHLDQLCLQHSSKAAPTWCRLLLKGEAQSAAVSSFLLGTDLLNRGLMTQWTVMWQEGRETLLISCTSCPWENLRKLPGTCSAGNHELLSIQQMSVQPHKEFDGPGWDQRKKKTIDFSPRAEHFWDSTNYGFWGVIEETQIRKDSGDRFGEDFYRCFHFLR